jgi:DNA-binding NarL/FixJ family response regulator
VPIKVLIADDSPFMRNSIASVLLTCKEIEVVGESDCFGQTVERTALLHPQVLVLDLHMPDEKQIDIFAVRAQLAECALIVISVWNDAETREYAMNMGADAFLDKATLGTDLIPKILSIGSRSHISV